MVEFATTHTLPYASTASGWSVPSCYAAASGAEDVGQIPSSLATVLMVIYRMQGRPQQVCCY